MTGTEKAKVLDAICPTNPNLCRVRTPSRVQANKKKTQPEPESNPTDRPIKATSHDFTDRDFNLFADESSLYFPIRDMQPVLSFFRREPRHTDNTEIILPTQKQPFTVVHDEIYPEAPHESLIDDAKMFVSWIQSEIRVWCRETEDTIDPPKTGYLF